LYGAAGGGGVMSRFDFLNLSACYYMTFVLIEVKEKRQRGWHCSWH